MERKVHANIEFQVIKGETCKVDQDDNLENACNFLPCEAVTLFYEYPVYICENGKESRQHTEYFIDSQALMCVLPDPLVCFEKASYSQSQIFHLELDGNLVLLDWFTSGRYSSGERWIFTKLKSVSSIFINGKLQFRESQNMQDTPFISIKNANKSYDIIGTCILIGPLLKFLYSSILTNLGKCRGYGEKPEKNLLFAVSPLHLNGDTEIHGCIIRFAAESVPKTIRKLEDLLKPLFPVIGDNPFANK